MTDVVDRFDSVTVNNPAHVAVKEDRSTSYAELGQLSRLIRSAIPDASDRQTRVLIHLPQIAEAYAAMFASLVLC